MRELNAIILAGGKSSRMGEDKALMPFRGYNSMAEYQYKRLQKIFSSVYLSSKSNKFDFDCNIILDRYEPSTPLVAIVSAFEELNCDAIFLISVDMPLISKKDIQALINSYFKEPDFDIYTLKSSFGVEPTVAIYTKKIATLALKMLQTNNYKLKNLIANSNTKTIFTEDNIVNINTKDDYFQHFK
jgi:molybdopterin-guanine dinucleotide biosynthesis protein A